MRVNKFDLAVGMAVRKVRNSLGITQQELADSLNVERVTYSKKETGVQVLTIQELFIVCDKLNTSPEVIYEEVRELMSNSNCCPNCGTILQ